MFKIIIYLDDNLDWEILISELEKNNFKLISPRKINMRRKGDDEHLKYASINKAIILTGEKNFRNQIQK